ncbi:hypothetical protein NL676_033605 [Syzygium grande]|nr:hypothetical protein NL676_033605 [Syzygium grande]
MAILALFIRLDVQSGLSVLFFLLFLGLWAAEAVLTLDEWILPEVALANWALPVATLPLDRYFCLVWFLAWLVVVLSLVRRYSHEVSFGFGGSYVSKSHYCFRWPGYFKCLDSAGPEAF